MRTCGDCQLCCKLLPMKEGATDELEATIDFVASIGLMEPREILEAERDFHKPAGERCKHQRHGKGCAIYDKRPLGCRLWNCRWLTVEDTCSLRRPDRAHYVIDLTADFCETDDTKCPHLPVIQVWVDPSYPDAPMQDADMRAYMDRRGAEGYATLVRLNAYDAYVIFPPSLTKKDWLVKKTGNNIMREHSPMEKAAVLGKMALVLEDGDHD